MGGYTGWSEFAFEPAQTDMVTMYGYESPTRLPHKVNNAANDELTISDDEGSDEETVRLLCEDDPAQTDATDLSAALQPGSREARR